MIAFTKRLLPSARAATLILVAISTSYSLGDDANRFRIHIDQGHPWKPPYGLERVGASSMASVERAGPNLAVKGTLWLSSRKASREIKRDKVAFAKDATRSLRIAMADDVAEVVLLQISDGASQEEIARQRIDRMELEVNAVAEASTVTNPVDLGVIFPPSNELLLGPGQTARVDVALLSRTKESRSIKVVVWFDETPTSKQKREVVLEPDKRVEIALEGINSPAGTDRTILNVALLDDHGDMLWQKKIPTMLVQQSPSWPQFGATQTILRYDAPISVRDPATATFSNLSYEKAWKPELQDIIVSLPNGARFVFWRGASYIPFWAGTHNTGLCYEWAERLPPSPEGAVDCVEPLMDKELRYGQVKIVESTSARVHIRWTYQSTDLLYNTWGDSAVEDYFFYPDGFGTRVVNLKREPDAQYELSEFIILTAAETYPLGVLPNNMVDALFLDGKKREFTFPKVPTQQPGASEWPNQPAIYRVRLHQDESSDAIYFTPNETEFPSVIFSPFFDAGELVTPTYWGSHWPLARGNATGSKIDERLHVTPCHNSLMSWANKRPRPLSSGLQMTVDAMGRSRKMMMERWAWLIGMTDVNDARLLDWARSFANPPSLEVDGASIELNAYSMERRAIRLSIDQPTVSITIKPTVRCVNPAFEFDGNPGDLAEIALDGKGIPADRYAWDGHTLWLQADIDSPVVLSLEFRSH